jgi:hypothetical protein
MNDDREVREVRALGRVIRLDLVIAVCALLISSLATLASFWQTVVVQKQLSAQVWPYLSVNSSLSSDQVSVSIENYGLGPALVRDLVITRDGVVQPNLYAFLGPSLRTLAHKAKRGETLGLDMTDLREGSAIRPGDHVTLFTAKETGIGAVITPLALRSQLEVCYCSILDQCWIADYNQSGPPKEVSGCTRHDPHFLGGAFGATLPPLAR